MKIDNGIEEIKIYNSQEEFIEGVQRVVNYFKINDTFEYSFEYSFKIPKKKTFLQKFLNYFRL